MEHQSSASLGGAALLTNWTELMGGSEVALLWAAVAVVVSAAVLLKFQTGSTTAFLDKTRKRMQIVDVQEISHDTKRIRLSLGGSRNFLGLPVGKHIRLFAPNPAGCVSSGKWNGRDDADKQEAEIHRTYTPVTGDECYGYVELIVKIYRPGKVCMPDGKEMTWEDGGKMSLYLDNKRPGDYVDVFGPVGVNEYLGRGSFKLPGRMVTGVKHIGMLAGGTGLTPMLQVVQAILRDTEDTTRCTLIYANKTEDDILCREMLDSLVQTSKGRFTLHYTVDFPPEKWEHKKGFITTTMIEDCFPKQCEDEMILMCGPPPMVEFACKKNLEALGYPKARMVNF